MKSIFFWVKLNRNIWDDFILQKKTHTGDGYEHVIIFKGRNFMIPVEKCISYKLIQIGKTYFHICAKPAQ